MSGQGIDLLDAIEKIDALLESLSVIKMTFLSQRQLDELEEQQSPGVPYWMPDPVGAYCRSSKPQQVSHEIQTNAYDSRLDGSRSVAC